MFIIKTRGLLVACSPLHFPCKLTPKAYFFVIDMKIENNPPQKMPKEANNLLSAEVSLVTVIMKRTRINKKQIPVFKLIVFILS